MWWEVKSLDLRTGDMNSKELVKGDELGKGWRNIHEMLRYNSYTPDPMESEDQRKEFDLKIKNGKHTKTGLWL